MKRKFSWTVCFVLLTLTALISFKPKISANQSPPPSNITDVTIEWITTGSGGCHVSGYKMTVVGGVGPSSTGKKVMME
jgi:hypothetical protein